MAENFFILIINGARIIAHCYDSPITKRKPSSISTRGSEVSELVVVLGVIHKTRVALCRLSNDIGVQNDHIRLPHFGSIFLVHCKRRPRHPSASPSPPPARVLPSSVPEVFVVATLRRARTHARRRFVVVRISGAADQDIE